MLSIIITAIFIGCLLAALKTNHEAWVGLSIITGLVALFAMIVLLTWPLAVESNIELYNRQKEIYYNLNMDKLSDLRKTQLLKDLVEMDTTMRTYIYNNKKFMWDLYMSDEDIEKIELVKGW